MKKITILGAVALFAGLASSSFASTISNGHFDISGTIVVANPGAVTPLGTCTGPAACIFFADPVGTPGKVDISNSGLPNGDIPGGPFPGPNTLAGNDAANISNLFNPPNVVDGPGFPNQLFMSFNTPTGNPVTTQLLINFIDPGIYSAAACGDPAVSGQQCTLPNSPFNFVNNPPPTPAGTPCGTKCQATATFVFEGVTSGNPGVQSTWVGNFSSQFPLGSTYQSIFAQLASQGFVSNTFSGTITLTPIPEPGSLLMIGSGLIGLAAFLRRRRATK